MKIDDLINLTQGLPVIESELLCAGMSDPGAIKVQLSRWEKAGKIIQLKRGVYLLAEIYRKADLYEPYLAGILKKPSYISLEKALEFHGLIPESAFVYTSVTTKRPGRYETPAGTFDYRHIKNTFFWGYESVTLRRQTAFFAAPEKALLDYFYLNQRKISSDYLEEMRLQNADRIDCDKLIRFAQKFDSPGILRAARVAVRFIEREMAQEKSL